jgi:UDPglucose 6-dehydrogenase
MRVTVTGLGYLGLVQAATLAEMGNHVVAMDNDEERMHLIENGVMPFYEPELAHLVEDHVKTGRLRFTSDVAEAGKYGDTHFLCVGTPMGGDGEADLSCLFEAVHALVPHLKGADNLLVGKSTTPPGIAAKLRVAARALTPMGVGVDVAWNPEFLREGTAVQDSLYPSRLVLGVYDKAAERRLREVYQYLIVAHTHVSVTDPRTAELGKLASNAFLATKMSFINGIAQYCDVNGGDVQGVADIMGWDHRIGRLGMHPGLGYGGGCIPKDVEMLTQLADDNGARRLAGFLKQVTRINSWRRQQVLILAKDLLTSFEGRRIAVLGLAFKPGTSDMRESPGVYLAHTLVNAGAEVVVYDPHTGECDFDNADTTEEAMACTDLVIVTTNDPAWTQIDPAQLVPGRVIDCRYVLDRGKWEAAGWDYHEVGR